MGECVRYPQSGGVKGLFSKGGELRMWGWLTTAAAWLKDIFKRKAADDARDRLKRKRDTLRGKGHNGNGNADVQR